MKLYSWQEEALQNWEKNGCIGIVDAVTGAGKTTLAVAAVRYLRGGCPKLKVKIVVPTIPLAEQWRQVMSGEAQSGEDIPGFFGGGRRDSADRNVLIYVINSARDTLPCHIRSDLSLGYSVFVIYDECHHYQSKENSRIFDLNTNEQFLKEQCYSLGLSATPFKEGENRILLSGIGPPVYRYGLSEAALDGVVSPFVIGQVALDFTTPEFEAYSELSVKLARTAQHLKRQYPALQKMKEAAFFQAVSALAKDAAGDPDNPAITYLTLSYQRRELSVSASARVSCCVDLIGRLHPRDRIIVFCERIPQAEQMAHLIRRRFGDVCGLYHSDLPKNARARVLSAFREGGSRILVTCRALDEGIDVPDANIGIVVSCSSVRRQRIQRIGRLLRRADGKTGACLYYFYIRRSREDPVFLHGIEHSRTFALQYDAADRLFSDAIYEYMARELLAQAETRQLPTESIREMRLCLLEGIGRADYLADANILEENRRTARNQHTRNYWFMIKKTGILTKGDLNDEL